MGPLPVWEAGPPGDALPEVLDALPGWIEEVRQYVEAIIGGCSPGQIVDCEPLASLGAETRQLLKEILHQAYLELELVQSDGREICRALEDLESTAEALRQAWVGSADQMERAGLVVRLGTAAQQLKQSLELSQEGIVVP